MRRPSWDHLAHLTQFVCSVIEEMNFVLATAHTYGMKYVKITWSQEEVEVKIVRQSNTNT